MTKKLRHIKKELGFSNADDLVYGYYNGYLVSFSPLSKEVELFVDAELDEHDSESLDKLRAFLKKNAASYRLTGTSFSPTGISVRALEKDAAALLEFFFIFMNQLRLLHVDGGDVCANCGEKIEGDAVVLKIGNHAHTCGDTCAKKIIEGGKAKKSDTPQPRIFLGLIGAVLIGLLGAVPYFLLGSFGLPCAPAAFLIPLASALGFYLFGGRPCTGKVIVCTLVPILLFLFAVSALLLLSVFREWSGSGFVFSFSDLYSAVYKSLAENTALRAQVVTRQLLYGGLFLFAGLIFTIPASFARRNPYFMILKDPKNG